MSLLFKNVLASQKFLCFPKMSSLSKKDRCTANKHSVDIQTVNLELGPGLTQTLLWEENGEKWAIHFKLFDPFSLVSCLQNDSTDHFISRMSFLLLLFPSDKRCNSEWRIHELIKQTTIETNKVTHTTWWEQQWGWISFVPLQRRKLQEEEKMMKCRRRWRRR